MNFLRHVTAAMLLLTFIACNGIVSDKNRAMIPGAQDKEVSPPSPGGAAAEKTEDYKAREYFAATDSTPAITGNGNKGPGQVKPTPAPVSNVDWDKKIIKTATLNVEITDYKVFNDFVHATAKQSGGYVAQEQQNETTYKIENVVTIKVPVDQFDNAINSLSPAKGKILAKSIASEDVTGEVVDTRSRLEAKRQARLRYLDLLKQAKNMEEVLDVQREIDGIQAEIESASGRVNYLSHASAYSTINLTFFQVLNPQAEQDDNPGFGQKVLLALENGLKWIGDLIVLLLTLWPLLVAGIFIWIGFKRWRASRPQTQAVPPASNK